MLGVLSGTVGLEIMAIGDFYMENNSAKIFKNESGFVREDGDPNEVVPTAEGTYKIELRTSEDAEAYTSCEYTASIDDIEPTPEPVPQCENPIGAHIAFIIDNSNSNDYTDCPDAIATGEVVDGVSLKECKSATNREIAVLSSFDLLKTYTEGDVIDKALAKSTISIASFPVRTGHSDIEKDSTISTLNCIYNT